MSPKREEVIDSFPTVEVPGDRMEQVYIIRQYADGDTRDGPDSIPIPIPVLRTADGKEVIRIEKGKYRISGSVFQLTSDAPNAP